jgi:hypothetical protein
MVSKCCNCVFANWWNDCSVNPDCNIGETRSDCPGPKTEDEIRKLLGLD